MEFVPLSIKHSEDLSELFLQLTGQPVRTVDVDAMLESSNYYAVLSNNGIIIGFGVLVDYYLPTVGKVGRIEDVIVHENYRGRGLGRMIVEKIIDTARQINLLQLQLTSNPQRLAARSLYGSVGFKMKDTDVFVLDLK